MIRPVRAAALPVALFAFAMAAFLGGTPLQALKGDFAPAAHYLDHAEATTPGLFALNDAEASGEAPALDPAAARAMLDEAARLVEAAVPRPRTLDELVPVYARAEVADAEEECLANAVYFEARGEPIAGQLAVAEVVLNRVVATKYPDTICEVVVQPWQFSFINPRTGAFPKANRASEAWRKSVAIARITMADRAASLPRETLWYHADYVAPGWGKRLNRHTKIGLHIFYT